jgi:hypothetical protein
MLFWQFTPQIWRDHAVATHTELEGNMSSFDWEEAPSAWKTSPDGLRTIETEAGSYEKHELLIDQLKSFGMPVLAVGPASNLEHTPQCLSYNGINATCLFGYGTVAFGVLSVPSLPNPHC